MELLKQNEQIFLFNDQSVRVVIKNSEKPMFIASDVCRILGLNNVSQAINTLPEKWKGIILSDTLGGKQQMSTISEPGLYKLIMKSKKPICDKFQAWVCEEVLTSIRENGEYKMKAEYEKKISHLENENKEISRQVLRKNKKKYNTGDCVYIVTNKNFPNQFKLGQTDNINNRIISFNNASPDEFILHKNWYTRFNKKIEKLAHETFIKYRVTQSNEWFEMPIISRVIEYITAQVELLEQFDTDEKIKPEPQQPEPDQTDKNIKQCSKCLETISITKFYLRKNIKDKKNENKKIEESDPEPNLDPSRYRSHCKKCCNSDTKELRKNIRQDENHNKNSCMSCETFLPLNLFYRHEDDTLYEQCITCYKEKENLPDAIKQCTACKELLEPIDFHVHSTDFVRSVCKQCRNDTIREKQATAEKSIVTCEFCEKEVLEKNLPLHHETKRCLQKQGKLKVSLRNKPQTLSARARGVVQYDKNGKEINRFVSLSDASEQTGVLHTSISSCCRGLYKTSGGFLWKYSNLKV